MKIFVIAALIFLSFKVAATTLVCTLEFKNDLTTGAVIMYQSFYPQLETPLGKLQKIVLAAKQSTVVSFSNIPYVKWDLIAPKREAKVVKNTTATSCNEGGIVKIEQRT